MLKVAECHAKTQVSVKPKKPSLKERKQKLLTFLKGTFFLLPCLQYCYMMCLPHVLIVVMVLQTLLSDREV